MRPEEEWAARCISQELRVEVKEHDDNSSPSMYDLTILYPDRPHGAVEVTAAVDQESVNLGKLVYDGGRKLDAREMSKPRVLEPPEGHQVGAWLRTARRDQPSETVIGPSSR